MGYILLSPFKFFKVYHFGLDFLFADCFLLRTAFVYIVSPHLAICKSQKEDSPKCAAIANGNDLRGLGTCHQQALCRNSFTKFLHMGSFYVKMHCLPVVSGTQDKLAFCILYNYKNYCSAPHSLFSWLKNSLEALEKT